MKKFNYALHVFIFGLLVSHLNATAATLTTSNIDTRQRVAQATFADLTFANAVQSSRNSLFFHGNVGDSGNFNLSLNAGFQSFAYFADAGISLTNVINPTSSGNPGAFTATIAGTTDQVAGFDTTRLASSTPSVFSLGISNGLYMLELKTNGSGFVRNGGTYIESLVLAGDWSSHGAGPGQSELLSVQSGFAITKNFLFDAVSNTTAFEMVNNNYNGSTASYDIVLHGDVAPIPEPETYAMMLTGLGLLGFMARRKKQQRAV